MKMHTSTSHFLLSAVLLIVASLYNLSATADELLSQDGVDYTLRGDTAIVTLISKTSVTTLNIPSTVTSKITGNSHRVTTINRSAAENSFMLEKVTYRSNLKYIESYAFRGCKNLKGFALYDSRLKSNLVSIGREAFFGCTALGTDNTHGTFELTSQVALNIGINVFENCTGIKDLNVRSATKLTIDNEAFKGCTALVTAYIDKCSTFGYGVFRNCTNLKSVNLGSATHVTLGSYFCYSCPAFTSLYTDGLGNGFSVVDKVGNGAFQDCTNLKWHNLGAIREIGNYAFKSCTGLTSLSLGSLETIGRNAFEGLTLGALTIPQTLKNFANLAFYGINTDVVYVYSQAVANATDVEPFGGTPTFTKLHFRYVEEINGTIFKNKDQVTTMTFDSYLRTIGDGVFQGMRKLQELNIDNPNLNIGSEAFRACPVLASVTLNCLNVCPNAFSDCTRMKTLDITALCVMDEAFSGCSGLQQTSFTVRGSIGRNVFTGCTGEVNINKWNNQPSSIDENALFNAGFTVINYNAPELTDFAIMGMPNLTTVNFKGTKRFTSRPVFYGCPSLKTFTMAESEGFKVEDNVIYTADGTTLVLTPPAKVDYAPIPATVRTIKSCAITSPQVVLDFSQIPVTPTFVDSSTNTLPAVIIANMAQDFSTVTKSYKKPHVVYVAGTPPTDVTGDGKTTVLDAVKAIEGLK